MRSRRRNGEGLTGASNPLEKRCRFAANFDRLAHKAIAGILVNRFSNIHLIPGRGRRGYRLAPANR